MPRNLRNRQDLSSGDECKEESNEPVIRERLEDLKILQKLRKKPSGIDARTLAIGGESNGSLNKRQISIDDPWKLKTGGLVDMSKINSSKNNDVRNNMNANFARETNQRDEDAEMQKFIEEQLRIKRSAESSTNKMNVSTTPLAKSIKKPEDALFDLPKHLITNTSKHKSEETLSEQMLSGIPEVDLGVEERIRNIEETDKAKQKLLTNLNVNKSNNDKDSEGNNQNAAINFVQHKRFDDPHTNNRHHNNDKRKKDDSKPNTPVAVVGDAEKHELLEKNKHNYDRNKRDLKRPGNDKASDDYCFERFRKNMRFSRGSKIKIA